MTMVAGDQRQRRDEVLLGRLLVELGEQHEHSPSPEAHDRLGEGAAVVGLDQLGLEVEQRFGHPSDLRSRLGRRQHGAHAASNTTRP